MRVAYLRRGQWGGSIVSVSLIADKGSHTGGVRTGKRPRKSDAVYQDLKRRILTGEMTSDSPITEKSLAQDFGCSQSTIREALMRLQECGLVVRRGYQGTYVTELSLPEARLMLKLRVSIEVAGVAEAVKFVTQCELDDLRELGCQFEARRLQRDVFACAEVDRTLHLKLFEIARMPVLEPVLVRTFMILQRVMLSTPRSDASWTRPDVTHHPAIFDALAARDTDATIDALTSHILSSAVLLAPHVYGTDVAQLQEEVDMLPFQPTLLAGGLS
jgi:DNA-binding GntR family transcriptional regulator